MCVCVCVCARAGKVQRIYSVTGIQGHAMAELVEALRYKPEGRGIDSRWCD